MINAVLQRFQQAETPRLKKARTAVAELEAEHQRVSSELAKAQQQNQKHQAVLAEIYARIGRHQTTETAMKSQIEAAERGLDEAGPLVLQKEAAVRSIALEIQAARAEVAAVQQEHQRLAEAAKDERLQAIDAEAGQLADEIDSALATLFGNLIRITELYREGVQILRATGHQHDDPFNRPDVMLLYVIDGVSLRHGLGQWSTRRNESGVATQPVTMRQALKLKGDQNG